MTYPDFYTETLKSISNINIPIQVLPFGCLFPSLNNFIFDLVLKTATPIILVLLLSFLSKVLRARSGGSGFGAFLADACSDLWFFIIFLVFPSCSTMTFTYFMRETYEEPGEAYVDLMRADRSINREEPLYQSFTVYAVVMLGVYPIGVPLLYALMFHRSRHQLHEMRRIELTRETDFALAKLEAEADATPEATSLEGADTSRPCPRVRGTPVDTPRPPSQWPPSQLFAPPWPRPRPPRPRGGMEDGGRGSNRVVGGDEKECASASGSDTRKRLSLNHNWK